MPHRESTRDLYYILLPQSSPIQEEEGEAFANRHRFSNHSPAPPLYTRQDALACLHLLKAKSQGETFGSIPGWYVTLHAAGHILGASSVLQADLPCSLEI
jgi:metallo-beta-lactamase family protein